MPGARSRMSRAGSSRCFVLGMLLFVCRAAQAAAQTSTAIQENPFQGSVPTGSVTATPLTLTLRDAIARGLATNLGVLESVENVRTSRAQWLSSLSNLLPSVTAR